MANGLDSLTFEGGGGKTVRQLAAEAHSIAGAAAFGGNVYFIHNGHRFRVRLTIEEVGTDGRPTSTEGESNA